MWGLFSSSALKKKDSLDLFAVDWKRKDSLDFFIVEFYFQNASSNNVSFLNKENTSPIHIKLNRNQTLNEESKSTSK